MSRTMMTGQPPAARNRVIWHLAAWLAFFALYGALIGPRITACAGGADTSGYLNAARLLSEFRVQVSTRALPDLPARELSAFAYVPMGFAPANPGDPTLMVPIYPAGFPLLLALAAPVLGLEASAHVVLLLHCFGGIVLTYALCRRVGCRTLTAALGALLLAGSPIYIFCSVQILSDVPSLVWTEAAVLLALSSGESSRSALAAGAAFSLAVLIRPTNALALLPIAIALGPNARKWVLFVAGGLPGAGVNFAYNAFAYGHPLRTGYGPIWSSFAMGNAMPALRAYAKWLAVLLTPAVVAAAFAPFHSRGKARTLVLLFVWAAVYCGFYLFYPFTQRGWTFLRFLLPAFPALIAATALAAEGLWSRATVDTGLAAQRALLVVACAFALAWTGVANRKLHALNAGNGERNYAEVAAWSRANLPPDAVLFAGQTTGSLYYYTNFVFVHWAFAADRDLAAIKRAAATRPVFAILFPFEEAPLFAQSFGGNWQRVTAIRDITVWRWRTAE